MDKLINKRPADTSHADLTVTAAPNPRRDYSHPGEIASDPSLPVAERVDLLSQWKDEVDCELTAQAEGMYYADHTMDACEALSREAQQVSKALTDLEA